MRTVLLALVVVAFAAPVSAQSVLTPPSRGKTVSLAGPRFGFTSLSQGIVDELHRRDINVGSAISQFGWQFERQFYGKEGSIGALNEVVVLVGGLDQSVVLPSVTWMVGLRSASGTEFGVGPNVTPAGVALAFAGGVTLRAGVLNVPMTVAVVPSKAGTRVSFLTGFNWRR